MSSRRFSYIPMIDLKEELKIMREPILASLTEVIDSGQYVLGEKGKKLERLVSQYTDALYGLGVANGTDALQLCLQALNIGPGDEVITTPFTFFATAEAIAQVGAKPVFVDIEENSYNIDASKIEDAITKNTKAIIVVHLYGQAAKMEEILEIGQKYNLRIIEDACQAIGTEYDNKRVGALGDIGCFSFFPSKSLGAFGDAGFVVTNKKELYEKVSSLRNHGSKEKYHHSFIGMNSRLDELQAAILLVKLNYLDYFLNKRKNIAKRYTEKLNHLFKTPTITDNRQHTFHQYCIELDFRDELASELTKNRIGSAIYYPIPLHLQKAFQSLHYKIGDFPIAEKTAKRILALPISPMLSVKQQDYIISTIIDFHNNEI